MEYVFGSTLVCKTTDAAKEVSLYHAFSIYSGVAAASYNFDSTWNMHCVDYFICLSFFLVTLYAFVAEPLVYRLLKLSLIIKAK